MHKINDIHIVMKKFLISARLILQRKIRPELMTIVKCIGYLQLKLLPLFLVQTSTTLLKLIKLIARLARCYVSNSMFRAILIEIS